jgi:3-deoxy-D-manno-octulosonic-acid transferase
MLPFAARSAVNKLRRAGVSVPRAHERLGNATEARPGGGPLVWFHAASVGESLSVLALIDRMGALLPRANFLITSGTATSAELIARRLPPRSRHQFAPLDAPGPVGRFLRHWRPEAAIFVESELWPLMLRHTRAAGARMALVNARLSEKSVGRWRRLPATARHLLEVFDLVLTQNEAMAQAMLTLGVPREKVAEGINLKSLSGPLPVDDLALTQARAALGDRPVWIAASTHEGEEAAVLRAHASLLKRFPDLCLILAPRHPERGQEVTGLIAGEGFTFTRRTRGDAPGGQVFLADTLGELGTWYALTRIVFMGGSLRLIGGHNPFEVAQAGAPVLSGTHVANFAETYAEMETAGAARMVSDAEDLCDRVAAWLDDPAALDRAAAAATRFAEARTGALDEVASRLIDALGLDGDA